MAEMLVKAIDATHPDPDKDRRGCYKRGMPVVVMDDGHEWGKEERLPKFVIIKIPLTSKDKIMKYIDPEPGLDVEGNIIIDRRRMWKIRLADLPLLARNKLQLSGELTIKATSSYTETYDYTWTQIKPYFRNLLTGLDEVNDF